jgi:hypothetical protein
MQREPPLVKVLPRQPGTKEARYAHLLSGDVEGAEHPARVEGRENASRAEGLPGNSSEPQKGTGAGNSGHQNAPAPEASADSLDSARLDRLKAEVAALRDEVADLRQQFAAFRKQFD